MGEKTSSNDNSTHSGHQQFLEEVFMTELREINRRREAVGLNPVKLPEETSQAVKQAEQTLQEAEKKVGEVEEKPSSIRRYMGKMLPSQEIRNARGTVEEGRKKLAEAQVALAKKVKPSTRHGLVGLALSGGGIRSATFNLGVLQALAKNGILKYVDYLSTVSGGGYIGTCLSSLLSRATAETAWERFPLYHTPGKEEPDAMKQLRNASNYLAPGGFLDKMRIPALVLRGILINFLVILPYILLAVIFTDVLYGEELRELAGAPGPLGWKSFYHLAFWAGAAFVLWVVSFPLIQHLIGIFGAKLNWRRRNRYELSFGLFLLILFLVAFIESLPAVLLYLEGYWKGDITEDLWTGISVVTALIPYAFSYKTSGIASKWSGKLSLWALGLLGPLILLLIYLRMSYWYVFHYERGFMGMVDWNHIYWGLGCLWGYTWLFVDVNLTSVHGFYRDRLSKAYLFQVLQAVFKITEASLQDLQDRGVPEEVVQELNKLKDLEVMGRRAFVTKLTETIGEPLTGRYKSSILDSARLKRECIEASDKQKLQALNPENTEAPYHLINVALNLPAGDDPNLRGRDADFFFFSKHFAGSERTGFCATDELEELDPHLDLGTAMAISGAAAAPNMGTTTIKPLVFIMTMLNIRLGYWLPNPRKVRKPLSKGYRFFRVGPPYLLKELFGRIDEDSMYVNLSDGGHIENLGIYELLRRRCKFIIAGDAEADPDLTFGGLAKLIRYARIDMGIKITIELEDLDKEKNGLSRKHCALGKIDYGGGEKGYLLYIKSAVIGDENVYIRQYRSENPDYPHESTADQFFDEAQFEVYRALGYHVVDGLFQERFVSKTKNKKPVDMVSWFEDLVSRLRPRFQMEEEFMDLQLQLSFIEEQFKDPDVLEYTYQIYPEIVPADYRAGRMNRWDTEQNPKIFHLCNLQMQLLENVFLALNLDKLRNRDHSFTRGWMNLFRRWAQAPSFRRAWAVSIGTYSVGFQSFCEEALKLRWEILWEPGQRENLSSREKEYLKRQQENKRFAPDEEIRLFGKSMPSDQVWVARMLIRNMQQEKIESFTIGLATVRISGDAGDASVNSESHPFSIELTFYRTRDYYRKMRLLDRMIPSLVRSLEKEFGRTPQMRIDLNTVPNGRLQYNFFERHGFKIIE